MINSKFSPDIKAGFEQVKTRYESKKKDYKKNHIEVKNDKEILKDVINEIFDKEINNNQITNDTNVKTFSVFSDDDTDNTRDEQKVNKKLEELVRIAFEKGITNAIVLSCKTSNAFLIDRLHDILIDRFYDELLKQNKIKQ